MFLCYHKNCPYYYNHLNSRTRLSVSDIFSEYSLIQSFSGIQVGNIIIIERLVSLSKKFALNETIATVKQKYKPKEIVRIPSQEANVGTDLVTIFLTAEGQIKLHTLFLLNPQYISASLY